MKKNQRGNKKTKKLLLTAEKVRDLKPIDTWTAGLGLAVERPLPGGWSAGLEAGHRWFELDAAHRNGSTIETRRERFGDWTARVSLARRWGRS